MLRRHGISMGPITVAWEKNHDAVKVSTANNRTWRIHAMEDLIKVLDILTWVPDATR